MREQQPLLSDSHGSASATAAATALPARDATVSAARSLPSELSSFPCLSIQTTTTLYTFFERIWNGAQSRAPAWARPVFVHCEETELIGAGCIAGLVGLFVAAGFLLLFPAMEAGWLRGLLKLAFTAQVLVGYACLFLFRNVNPGYIPVNEGAIDAQTAEILSRPEYAGTFLIATRPYEPVYSAREVARESARRAAAEAAGDYAHLDRAMSGQTDLALEEEWCRICRVWRPPRAAHCYVCQQCTSRFDHHCGLLGNCVGQRNHRFFLGFVTLVGSGALTLLLADLVWIGQLHPLTASAWSGLSLYLALLLLPVFSAGCAFGFIAYFHCWMLSMDVTMKEKYGRRRLLTGATSVGALSWREKIEEVWETILWGPPVQLKGETVALRQKRAERRNRAGHYQPDRQCSAEEGGPLLSSIAVVGSSSSSSASAAALAAQNGEEQLGCVPAAANAHGGASSPSSPISPVSVSASDNSLHKRE